MIKVRIYRFEKNICGFVVKGHSGLSKAGTDIVCAAVTVLTFNTVNSIEKFTESKLKVSSAPNGGKLKCILPEVKIGKICPKTKLLLDAMLLGLKDIEDQYEKNLHIIDID